MRIEIWRLLWRQRLGFLRIRAFRKLEAALSAIAGDGPDPIELERRIEELEAENHALRDRLGKARAEIERIMARLRFLEG